MSGVDAGFKALLEAIPDAVLVVDEEGFINQANEQSAILFGYTTNEFEGMEIERLIPQRFGERHVVQRRAFLHAPQTRAMGSGLELFGRHKSGHEFPVDIMLGPIALAGRTMAMAVVRDISERKRTEQALTEARDVLEQRVQARTAELATANAQLENNLQHLNVLAETSRAFAEVSLDYQALLNMAAQQISKELADSCTIRLLSEDGQWLQVAAVYNKDPQAMEITRTALNANPLRVDDPHPTRQVMETGQPLLLTRIEPTQFTESLKPELREPLKHLSLGGMIIAPMRYRGKILGVLSIARQADNKAAFDENDLNLTQDLADRTALAIANAILFRDLEDSRDAMEQAVVERTRELRQRTEMIDLASDAIIIRGLEQDTIHYWNLGAEHLYGWTAREVTGRPIHQILKTVFPKPFEEIRDDFLKTSHWEGELVHTCRDGRVITVASRWTLERDEAGQPTGFLEINTDITEEKQLDAERKHLENQLRESAVRAEVLAEISKALAENNQHDQELFEFVARQVARLLGDACVITLLAEDRQVLETKALAHRDPQGQAYLQSQMPKTSPVAQSGYAGLVIQTGQAQRIADMQETANQAAATVPYRQFVDQFGVASLLIVPLRARGVVLGTVGATRPNKSQAYDASDEAFLQDIADRVGLAIANSQLYIDAIAAQKAADEANRAKSEFLSRMSHELRTPLNAVLGFAQLLEMEQPTPRQAQGLTHILRAGKHLLGLINEVLDLTRIETGRLAMSPEAVNLSDTIGEALDLVQNQAVRQQIVIETQIPNSTFVKADRQHLKQVLLNLLSNAIKYNRVGGNIWVTAAPEPGGIVRIAVRDTGAGIRPEMMPRLFTPFDRLGAEQSDVEGTGLGLALSRRLVFAMQGELGVDSQLNEGSTFWVKLPVINSPVAKTDDDEFLAQAKLQADSLLRQSVKWVLNIEDNPSNLQLIKQVFDYRPSIQLITAGTGASGLEQAKSKLPDLILLDLHLPDIMGLEVLQRLQADPETRNIPVVVVSADATARQIERLRSAGAKDYLSKPLNISAFLKVVDGLLKTDQAGPN